MKARIGPRILALVNECPTHAFDVADALEMNAQLASAHLAHLARRGAIERCGKLYNEGRKKVTLYRMKGGPAV